MQGRNEKRRSKLQKYPSYAAEIAEIKKNGITETLLNQIIKKHRENAEYNRYLIERYEALDECVPIFERIPRFDSSAADAINHRINNDFFSEIVDFKTGYFAGNPIAYSYAETVESLEDTGDAGDSESEMEEARDIAVKQLTDFITRSNMFDKDMECTKYASICGYAGRLFYIDTDGMERVMIVPPYSTIILSESGDITQPTFGVRYYEVETDVHGNKKTCAEFYDSDKIIFAEGSENNLKFVKEEENLFEMCPLQGIPNNLEMQGDAEKVLALIDAYDRALSDANNEIDAFANAYMKFRDIIIDENEFEKLKKAGAIQFNTGGEGGDVSFLTKDINDAFVEHHLDRLEENIYRFSKTPNLTDETFGNATGVALKFKLTGLEIKCGMFEAKMISAGTYMWQLLAKAWAKRQIKVDPLLVTMDFKRNFPHMTLDNAQAAQALIAAGVPKQIAWAICIPEIDDVEYVMQVAEQERENIAPLTDNLPEDDEDTAENE